MSIFDLYIWNYISHYEIYRQKNILKFLTIDQENSDEYGVSQIFIAIEVDKLIDGATRDAKLQRIMDFITTAERADDNVAIRLPGHEFTKLLDDNRRHGITIDDSVWAKIQAL